VSRFLDQRQEKEDEEIDPQISDYADPRKQVQVTKPVVDFICVICEICGSTSYAPVSCPSPGNPAR